MSVLVDTSIWVDFIRDRRVAHVEELARLLQSRIAVWIAPPILQEILQGAATHEHQAALDRRFRSIPNLGFANPLDGARAAARVYLNCRVAGKTPRSSNDCLIACLAMEHDVALLHNDRDFDAIAAVEPQLRIYRYAA